VFKQKDMKNLLFLFLFLPIFLFAHPSPNTLISLDIKTDGVAAELQIPVGELQLAWGANAPKNGVDFTTTYADSLRNYLKAHITPLSMDGQKWTVEVGEMALQEADAQQRGTLQDLLIKVWLKPPSGVSSRQFLFNYDVVMHQLVTHTALVSIRQDWETGVVAEHPEDVGYIAVEPRNGQIFPLTISRESKGLWGGFKSMVGLGVRHIAEGTDHLLFLLTLLLAAPLLVSGKKWGDFGGTRYALTQLIKIITAFTVGHSLTLIAGTLGWVGFPSQPIEILIAISIGVTAIHAIKPLFPSREIIVAAVFGLIHGLAFANTLADLDLNTTALTLSLLGFNVGIELMQLAVVALTMPSLIVLSQYPKIYDFIRIGGAVFAGIAAIAWVFERISGQSNVITDGVESVFGYSRWLIGGLAVLAVGVYFFYKNRQK
jgi:HupE / UreJ protein